MDDISKILKSYPADCRPNSVEPLGSAGGMSGARFWRIVAPRGALILRCWPMEHPTPARLKFIHAVLEHAAARGVTFLPVPIGTSDGATFVSEAGHLWELAPWLPGVADYETSPCVEKLSAAMRMLAQFHLAVVDFPADLPPASSRGRAPAITHRLSRLRELERGGIAKLTSAISDTVWPELAPLAREVTAELPRVVPTAIARLAPLANIPLPLQPCIRDIWHDHILFTGNVVTGLIDFGAIQIDTPAADVARLLGSLVADDANGWQQGLAAYSALRPFSAEESLAVFAVDTAGTVLSLCNWIRWIYLEDRQFENEPRITTRFIRLLDRVCAIVDGAQF